MDITEKIYEAAMRWKRRRQESELERSRYHLKDCDKALGVILQPFFEESIEIHAARQSGVVGRVLYLPESIQFFDQPQRNRDLYIHQALYLAAAQKVNIHWSEINHTAYSRGLQFAKIRFELRSQILAIYPSFSDFHAQLSKEFFERLPPSSNRPARQLIKILSSECPDVDEYFDPKRLKRNEPFPENLWLLWGGLSSDVKPLTDLPERSPQSKSASAESEMDMQTHFEKKEVNLDKEEHNPVMHAFEKLETVDEYQGGSRTADGSDQLEEHQEALQEIQPRHVTRSGEEARSLFKSDASQGSGWGGSLQSAEKAADYLYYSEWHFKKKRLLSDYCRLRVSTPELTGGSSLRTRLLETQGALIERTQRQLNEIRNQRKWRRGQLDGTDVDLDAYVRYLSDLQNKNSSEGALYQKQLPSERELQIMILLDFSLSTDSYVANRRVLDTEMEAVGLWGLLQADPHENTIVAGTFSETRHHCAFEYLKKQNEDWGKFFQRAENAVPRGYTRLGPAIRHATQVLKKTSARKKVLIILTDGKPTDYDGYEGRYGIEDIHKACLAAEEMQISTRAFAIEKVAKSYFPQMFCSYEILADPARLPESMIKTLARMRR